jgi:hypothetical protein
MPNGWKGGFAHRHQVRLRCDLHPMCVGRAAAMGLLDQKIGQFNPLIPHREITLQNNRLVRRTSKHNGAVRSALPAGAPAGGFFSHFLRHKR